MYTTVRATSTAVLNAGALARSERGGDGDSSWQSRLPLLIQAVEAEAGVAEPKVAARALEQAAGDIARAVSLVRAWAACLPQAGTSHVDPEAMDLVRRISPAFREPDGGQYLGATLDFEQRLLDLGTTARLGQTAGLGGLEELGGSQALGVTEGAGEPGFAHPSAGSCGIGALRVGRAGRGLDAEGIIVRGPRAEPVDRTRTPCPAGSGRGPLMQLLSMADSGALTAVAYTAVRGDGVAADPTLLELRSGRAEVLLTCPLSGTVVRVGRVEVTVAEVALYGATPTEGGRESRLHLGIGASLGRSERRAVAAAVIDARCARVSDRPSAPRSPAEDEEFLVVALDGQEAAGFVEHLKLPHYVTFTSDLERVRPSSTNDAALAEGS